MPTVFISYRRDDCEHVAGRIYDRLAGHFGRNAVFMDIDNIPFGVDYREHLGRAVSQCDILLALIGDGWVGAQHKEGPRMGLRRLHDPADFVRIEIGSALARGIPVIPVLVSKATMPGEEELPGELKPLVYRNAAEVRSGRDFNDHVERLIVGIQFLTGNQQESDSAEGHQHPRVTGKASQGGTAGRDTRPGKEHRRRDEEELLQEASEIPTAIPCDDDSDLPEPVEMVYRYHAISAMGVESRGEIKAVSVYDAIKKLKRKGLFAKEIVEMAQGNEAGGAWVRWFSKLMSKGE